MDIFMEYIVRHRKTGKDYAAIAGIVIGGLVLCLLSTIMLTIPLVSGLWPLVVAGIVYLAYILIRRKTVEFEYILTNNELDIDKIMAKSSRKHQITIDFKTIEVCAPVNDPDHSYEYNNTENIIKTLDCTGDGKTDIYFIDTNDGNGRVRVLFQPPLRLIESAKKFNMRKVFIA